MEHGLGERFGRKLSLNHPDIEGQSLQCLSGLPAMAMLVGLTPCPLAHFHKIKRQFWAENRMMGSNQEARFVNFKMDDVKRFLMSRTACKPFWSSTSWKQPYYQDNFELRLAPHCHTVHFIVQGSRRLPSVGEDFTGWGGGRSC